MEYLKFTFETFWHFAGVLVLFSLLVSMFAMIVDCLFRSWNRFLRHASIRKHGWPPPNCDADGDFRPED